MPDYRALAVAAARRYGIDPQIFLRQIRQESGFNPHAVSRAGARGIAQFMPATARGAGINPDDPVQALNAAARMDAQNLHKYGNWQDVLSLYNSGRGWSQGRNIGETRNYVRSILGGGGGSVSAPSVSGMGSGGGPAQAAPNLSGVRAGILQGLIAASTAQGQGQVADYTPVFAGLAQLRRGPSSPVGGQSMGPPPAVGSSQSGGGSSLSFLSPLAKQFGLQITSTTGGHHVPGSYHYQGRAEDYAGNPRREAALQRYALAHAGEFREVFYTGPGAAPYYVKNGKVYPVASLEPSVARGHTDHVHIAR